MAEDKTIVDPLDVSFSDDPANQYPPIRSPKLKWGQILNPFRKDEEEEETSVPLEEVLTPAQLAEEKRKQAELEAMPDEIDVPEIETHVEDLPEGNENEKELVVEHKDDNAAPSEDNDFAKQIDNILGIRGKPQGEESVPSPEEIEILSEGFNEARNETEKPEEETGNVGGNTEEPETEENGQEENVVDEEKEKRKKLMKEMRALAQNPLKGFKYSPEMEKWTPKQKQDAIKAWLSNQSKEEPIEEEPVESETPPMTDEEALAEARMIAQDDLDGFEVNGKDWSKLSTKEKFQVVDNFKNKNQDPKKEIHNENTENNHEAYKHYPPWIRVFEDVLGGANNVANRMAGAAGTNLAGNESINNAVDRANIPHYDYRSFFR